MSRPTPALMDAALCPFWATCTALTRTGRRSTPLRVGCFGICRAAMSWKCEKQKAVALSSCEAEIMAASETAKEAIYLRRFLEQFGLQDPEQP
eukprot:6866668-Prymnesium_polylepis.1